MHKTKFIGGQAIAVTYASYSFAPVLRAPPLPVPLPHFVAERETDRRELFCASSSNEQFLYNKVSWWQMRRVITLAHAHRVQQAVWCDFAIHAGRFVESHAGGLRISEKCLRDRPVGCGLGGFAVVERRGGVESTIAASETGARAGILGAGGACSHGGGIAGIGQGRKTLPGRAWMLEPQPAVPPREPPIRVRKTVADCWIALELIEGKNRQVRRMTAAVGHPTLRLLRVRIGDFELGELAPGKWKVLSAAERELVLG